VTVLWPPKGTPLGASPAPLWRWVNGQMVPVMPLDAGLRPGPVVCAGCGKTPAQVQGEWYGELVLQDDGTRVAMEVCPRCRAGAG